MTEWEIKAYEWHDQIYIFKRLLWHHRGEELEKVIHFLNCLILEGLAAGTENYILLPILIQFSDKTHLACVWRLT